MTAASAPSVSSHPRPLNGLLERADLFFLQRDFTPEGIDFADRAASNYGSVADRLNMSIDGQYARAREAQALHFLARASTGADKKRLFMKGVTEMKQARNWFERNYGRNPETNPQMDLWAKKVYSEVLYFHGLNLTGWIEENGGGFSTERRNIERDMDTIMQLGMGSIEDYGPYRYLGQARNDLNALKTAYEKTRRGGVGVSVNGWNTVAYAEALTKSGSAAEAKRILAEFVASPADGLSIDLVAENRMLQNRASGRRFLSQSQGRSQNAGPAGFVGLASRSHASRGYEGDVDHPGAWPQAVAGEYVVQFKHALSGAEQMQFTRQFSDWASEMKVKDWGDGETVLVEAAPSFRSQARERLFASSLVKYVEPNFIFHVNYVPNDPFFSQSWGLQNTGQEDSKKTKGIEGVDIGAVAAWDITKGSRDIVVAVIDTGLDFSTPDLQGNIWVNEAEARGKAGIDDDNNGYIDDVNGYDFFNNLANPEDDHGHGTHCAGVIAGRGDNGTGIAGVCWNCRIMPLKFMGANGGGSLMAAVKAIKYATKMGARLTNNSWGGGEKSEILMEAIREASQAGVLFVAAAGNSGNDVSAIPEYPAAFEIPNILSVAAVDNRGRLAPFSNFGKTRIHIGAPGVNVLSPIIGGFDSWSGTSMAAPHVAGVAALLWSNEPTLTMEQVKQRLISTAAPLAALRGHTIAQGMVNAYYALKNMAAPPDKHDPIQWASVPVTVSTDHNYGEGTDRTWTVKVPGAKRLAVRFKKFATEKYFDRLFFFDGQGQLMTLWSDQRVDEFSQIVDGDTMVLRFVSDYSLNDYGFDIEAAAIER
jgi:subtilisin family serine protease